MSDMNPLFEPKISSDMSNMVQVNAFRLNAEAYSGYVFWGEIESIEIVKLQKTVHVFGFGPFKRIYISNPEYGLEYSCSSQ